MDAALLIIYFILLFACAYTDFTKSKIYNKYLIIYLLIYILLYCFKYIIALITNYTHINSINIELIDSLVGLIVGFIIGFIMYILGAFKGGDSKLIAIVGLNSGFNNIFTHFSIIIIVAGIGALFVLIKNRILVKRLKRVYLYFKGILLTKHFEKYITETNDNIKFPFAIYILAGEIVSYLVYFMRG